MTALFQSAAWPLWSLISLIWMSVLYQRNKACELGIWLIAQAENRFAGDRAGKWKRRWVVRRLSQEILPFLRPVFTEDVLEELVQEIYENRKKLQTEGSGRRLDIRSELTAHTGQFVR